MPDAWLSEPISEYVWNANYRARDTGIGEEPSMAASWDRVALALSKPELHHRDDWRDRFGQILAHFRFLPGGRIVAGAGSARRVTLFSSFVMGQLHDSLDGIFLSLGESMITLQAGGGIGIDFSTLRPSGTPAAHSGNTASGPVSFMQVWEAAGAALLSTSVRRGAMMATLRCDHPDIERFIDARRDGALPHFRLSVLVSDAFLQAVDEDAGWPLLFPLAGRPVPAGGVVAERLWSGADSPEPCLVARTVHARSLWERLLRVAFECGEPGVIFIDHVQRSNNLRYAEQLSACSPLGEAPLPPHGACPLGSLNLAQFVEYPFGQHARLDLQAIAETVTLATRMLDNVYEASALPLKAQATVAHRSRRLGIGITGLADAFAMLGVRYGEDSSLEIAEAAMRTVSHAAYRASAALSEERGAFPLYQAAEYLGGDFIQTLPKEIIEGIWQHGIRNSHLTALAPARTISVLANNVSRGIDPVGAFQCQRQMHAPDGSTIMVDASDYAYKRFRELAGEHAPLPPGFVEAADIDPGRQLLLISRLQAHVDQAISKTVTLAPNASFEQFRDLMNDAYRLGLKRCTLARTAAPAAYVDGSRAGA